ncbi:GNAT family N-acetyltransferase [Vreelandella janggokensis]|uniref:GNAT family N-acetyltransferase n=1 Tax=Vreelandella janggokensis TaxID=370767 RepID=UPI002858E3D1|nr:GNAT family N-acetyltransferase [Halomonas janggokensis]MDR5884677.1 GNAT family N-acetyltransferase [Halomonas janggokensis]
MSRSVQAQPQVHAPSESHTVASLLSRPEGYTYQVIGDNTTQSLIVKGDQERLEWSLVDDSNTLTLRWPQRSAPPLPALLAAIEGAFAVYPGSVALRLQLPSALHTKLCATGVAVRDSQGALWAYAELFWQLPTLWLTPPPTRPYPQQPILENGKRHPRRPPRPSGTVYQRHIAWLDATLSFRVLDLEQDLERFNRWMNDPVVAHFWEEQGDLAQHRERLESTLQNPSVVPLIGCIDGEPFGYFETYWAKEDRIGAYYDADDFDRGWHVLIGEAAFRGRPYVAAWMPSISHYLFLDDCRTQRLVIEPRVDNAKMLRNLAQCGYAHVKAFDFPHKRAMLGMQLREHFFNERSWIPLPPHPGSAPRPDPRFTP